MSYATEITIARNMLSFLYDEHGYIVPRKMNAVQFRKLDELIKKVYPAIKRGDVISTKKRDNRIDNDETWIWDGQRSILLKYKQDKSFVPKQFIVTDTEFAPDYWTQCLNNGNKFWPSDEIRNRVLENAYYTGFKVDDKDLVGCCAKFEIGGKSYLLYGKENEITTETCMDRPYHYESPGTLYI